MAIGKQGKPFDCSSTVAIDVASPEVHAWIAGIFEGEGTIGLYSNGVRAKRSKYLTVAIAQKERDLAETLCTLTGLGCINRRTDQWQCYYWRLNGTAVIRLMKYILPHMRITYKVNQTLRALTEYCYYVQRIKKTFRYNTPSGKLKYTYRLPSKMRKAGGVL